MNDTIDDKSLKDTLEDVRKYQQPGKDDQSTNQLRTEQRLERGKQNALKKLDYSIPLMHRLLHENNLLPEDFSLMSISLIIAEKERNDLINKGKFHMQKVHEIYEIARRHT